MKLLRAQAARLKRVAPSTCQCHVLLFIRQDYLHRSTIYYSYSTNFSLLIRGGKVIGIGLDWLGRPGKEPACFPYFFKFMSKYVYFAAFQMAGFQFL